MQAVNAQNSILMHTGVTRLLQNAGLRHPAFEANDARIAVTSFED